MTIHMDICTPKYMMIYVLYAYYMLRCIAYIYIYIVQTTQITYDYLGYLGVVSRNTNIIQTRPANLCLLNFNQTPTQLFHGKKSYVNKRVRICTVYQYQYIYIIYKFLSGHTWNSWSEDDWPFRCLPKNMFCFVSVGSNQYQIQNLVT